MTTPTQTDTMWYYQLMGLATGPVTEARLLEMMEKGDLVAASTVSVSAKGPWTRLDEVERFRDSVRAAPDIALDVSADDAARVPVAANPAAPQNMPVDEPGIVIDTDESPGIVVEPDGESGEGPIEIGPRDSDSDEYEIADFQETEPVRIPVPAKRPVRPDSHPDFSPVDLAVAVRAAAKPSKQEPANLPWWRQYSRYLLVGALAIVAGWFALGLFETTPADAYGTFNRVWKTYNEKRTQSIPNEEWNDFLRAQQAEVSAALEPLAKQASAKNESVQSLYWAGKELLKALRGSREVPVSVRFRFESFMADYRGDDPPPLPDETPGMQADPSAAPSARPPLDPAFRR